MTNAMLRDFDLAAPNPADQRRVEILADGLPLFGGAQLAVDTTLVSPSHCDGSPHPRAANVDGAVLQAARLRKERTYPELVGPRRRARLVVLAGEVGGQRKPDGSCPCWPERSHPSCRNELSKRGG